MDTARDKMPSDGFQARGQAWSPERPDVIDLLSNGQHRDTLPIYYGSNHCFLVTIDGGPAGVSLAVYKPARGEYPLYDFSSGTLYKREVGSWLLDSLLNWRVIPPTVMANGIYGVGSLQLFIESYGEAEIEVSELKRLALADVILNNADRKPEHCLLGHEGKLWGIDHGLTFHAMPKLRTVLWHFAGESIDEKECEDLRRLLGALRDGAEPQVRELRLLLSAREWRALLDRTNRLVQSGRFPDPQYKSIPYRW